MAIQANPLLTPGPQSGPNSGPAAQFVQNIIALQLVHVVGGLNKIDEKMEVLVGLVSESVKNQNTNRGPKSRDKDGDKKGIGIPDIAIGTMIGNLLTTGVTKLFGAVTGVFTTLAGSITKYLTPVALVSSAIQSNSSGYSTMGKAFQVLGTALGMVLLPAFALVGSTAVTLADKIANELLPSLGEWIEFILTKGLSAIDFFVASIQAAGDMVKIFTEAAKNFIEFMNSDSAAAKGIRAATGMDTAKMIMDNLSDKQKESLTNGANAAGFALNPLAGIYQQRLNERLAERDRYNSGQSNDFEQGEDGVFRRKKTLREGVFENMRGFAEEMRRSLGGNSQSVGLSDLGRQIQQAALNQSPFEQKMLDWSLKALAELEKITAKLDKPVGH